MGREIVYCEGCGTSLREVDFEKGKAREIDLRHFCTSCRPFEAPPVKPPPSSAPRESRKRPSSAEWSTPRRPVPTAPRGSNPAVIVGAAVGILILLILIVAALSGSPRTAGPPTPARERSAPAPSPEVRREPAGEPAARRAAPAQREPAVLREPSEQEKNASFDAFLAQVRSTIAADKAFERRPEIEGMISAAEKSAGPRLAEVQALRALQAKTFDDAAKAACDAARAEAERLWAEKKVAEAIARAGEIPEVFRATLHAAELRKLAESFEQRAAKEREEAAARWKAWKVDTGGDDPAGVYLPTYGGRSHVYQTHPHSQEKPAVLERTVEVPAGKKTRLSFWVAPDARGDWELRVVADGKELHRQIVGGPGSGWKQVAVDLTPLAGKKVALRLENVANDWSWEYGYWADLDLKSE